MSNTYGNGPNLNDCYIVMHVVLIGINLAMKKHSATQL